VSPDTAGSRPPRPDAPGGGATLGAMATIYFYDVMVAVHVAAIVIAFGVTFAYPVFMPWITRNHPESLAVMHEVQGRIGKFLITPFATLALLAGIYLASDRDYWKQPWVTIPFVILIVLLGLGGAFFAPRERKLAALAKRDGATLSDEYHAAAKPVTIVGAVASLLVLVAVFVMIVKPFTA